MLAKLFDFQGVKVRAVVIDGEPWWVLSDSAKLLGHRDAANALRLLRERHWRWYSNLSTSAGARRVRVINKQGLNRLIMRSSNPEAEAFQDWIEGEVIPSLLEKGAYTMPGAQAAALVDDPEAVLALALEECRRRKAAEARAIEAEAERDDLKETVVVLGAAAAVGEAMAQGAGECDLDEALGMLCNDKVIGRITKKEMIAWLLAPARRWLYRLGKRGKLRASADARSEGLMVVREQPYPHPHTGVIAYDPKPMFTSAGFTTMLAEMREEKLRAENAPLQEAMGKAEQLTLDARPKQPLAERGPTVTPEQMDEWMKSSGFGPVRVVN